MQAAAPGDERSRARRVLSRARDGGECRDSADGSEPSMRVDADECAAPGQSSADLPLNERVDDGRRERARDHGPTRCARAHARAVL